MKRIELHQLAVADIEAVAEYGAIQFGVEHAALYHDELIKQFQLLAEHPRIGRQIEPGALGMHRFAFGLHIIVYSIEPGSVVIRRIIHGRMDVLRQLG
jgi:toxin ParE1/3/4